MQTIKTGVVIVLLIAVCYGAFVALNAPEADIPKELQQWANSEEFEGLMDIEMPSGEPEISFDMGAAEPLVAGELTAMGETTADGADGLPTFPAMDTTESSAFNSEATVTNFPDPPAFPEVPSLIDSASLDTGLLPAEPFPLNETMPEPAAPVLDGPAVPFTTAETKVGEAPAAEFVSTRQENKGDWADAQNLPLLPTNGENSASGDTNVDGSSLPTMPFAIAREQALLKASAGSLRQALEMLSPYYESPELGHAEHSDLVDILDALSREAIYSSRHLIEPAYHVEVNDTVASVAAKHKISPELLTAINGMGNAKALVAGTTLKVVQGPFRARISLNRGELTLFLGDLYAGRFPISVGEDGPRNEGVYFIEDKSRDRTYYGNGGRVIQGGDPENPYGGYWVGMGRDLSIHGSPEMTQSDLKTAGCISLAPLDAKDVYNILTKQSQVEIRR